MLLIAFALTTLGARPAAQDPKPADIRIGDDPTRRYLLHAPPEEAPVPPQGWKLLVVMPGGGGDEGFAPFVGRIRGNALERDWLVAQLVAPKWDEKQGETNVWPTKRNPYPGMKRSTEELFEAVLEDVGKARKLDPRYLFTLAWSSSGTAAYTLALDPKSRVTGTFVAMSVFKPETLPALKGAAGRRFFVMHSPTDFIPIAMAEQARDDLRKNGAQVEFATYEGGHGWHGDVYGRMRKGFDGLIEGAGKAQKVGKSRPK